MGIGQAPPPLGVAMAAVPGAVAGVGTHSQVAQEEAPRQAQTFRSTTSGADFITLGVLYGKEVLEFMGSHGLK